MQFILLPFALCFLLYIRQENRCRFWAATALKVTLTLTLALCLLVALLRRYSPVLLAANLGMVLCAGGDYFLQYIRRSPGKFTCGILLFSLGHVCNLVALLLLAPFRPSALAVLAALPMSMRPRTQTAIIIARLRSKTARILHRRRNLLRCKRILYRLPPKR